MTFHDQHWFLSDLQYFYLDDGFTLIATTDVPCHLWARMTTTPPRKHALPSFRRGLYLQGDIRFCFVVYEDNEQVEVGDTLTHTWHKSAWPVCETRWFYFVGTILGAPVASESPIFTFHFPAPPPEPPPPLERLFLPYDDNRTIWYSHGTWATCRNTLAGNIANWHNLPLAMLASGARLTASYFIYRSYLRFATTGFPITAQIVSAQLSLYPRSIERTSDILIQDIIITAGVQDVPPIPANYGEQLPHGTPGGSMRLNDMVLGSYNDIHFNNLGLTWINLTTDTFLCIREQHDIDDQAPVLGSNVLTYYSEQRGVGYRPILRVQYNPA